MLWRWPWRRTLGKEVVVGAVRGAVTRAAARDGCASLTVAGVVAGRAAARRGARGAAAREVAEVVMHVATCMAEVGRVAVGASNSGKRALPFTFSGQVLSLWRYVDLRSNSRGVMVSVGW